MKTQTQLTEKTAEYEKLCAEHKKLEERITRDLVEVAALKVLQVSNVVSWDSSILYIFKPTCADARWALMHHIPSVTGPLLT